MNNGTKNSSSGKISINKLAFLVLLYFFNYFIFFSIASSYPLTAYPLTA